MRKANRSKEEIRAELLARLEALENYEAKQGIREERADVARELVNSVNRFKSGAKTGADVLAEIEEIFQGYKGN